MFPNGSTPGLEWANTTSNTCWATDAAARNGKYYFYLSAGSTRVAVVVSSNPNGPWHDPLGHPLLEHGEKYNPPTQIRDPGVLNDPITGEYYIVFGTFNYYIAKLNPDMISLAESPRFVHVNNIWAGQNGPNVTDDKPFLHVFNDTYYLSWGAFYGISKSVYGPYQFVGTFIDPSHIEPDFRMPVDPTKPWYKQLDYKDRHGAFMQLHNQWYFSTNDLSHSADKVNPNSYRDTVFSYVHYLPNGTIAPLEITARGVNEHNATAGWIEVEEYFKLEHGSKAFCDDSGRFEVTATQGTYLEYHHVHLGWVEPTTLFLRMRSEILTNPREVLIRVFVKEQGGLKQSVTTCSFDIGGGPKYAELACNIGVLPSSTVLLSLNVLSDHPSNTLFLDAFRMSKGKSASF